VFTLELKKYGRNAGIDARGSSVWAGGDECGGALAATDRARAKKFTEALWNAPIPSGQNRYYDGMLYLMSLMHCGGDFRIWAPK
jgi:oligosaccharide reducing-end xylanase